VRWLLGLTVSTPVLRTSDSGINGNHALTDLASHAWPVGASNPKFLALVN